MQHDKKEQLPDIYFGSNAALLETEEPREKSIDYPQAINYRSDHQTGKSKRITNSDADATKHITAKR